MYKSSFKNKIFSNIKNIPGWSTKRKIVVFSVDDYGNVRIKSKDALENLGKLGLDVSNTRFNQFDCLENTRDLSNLFEVLTSVKDKNGRNAVFTPFSNIANIDFEAIKTNNYDKYRFEWLPITLSKLPGYENTWNLWKEGVSSGIFSPQFHGREHLNVFLFNELIQKKDEFLMACIDNESFSGLPTGYYNHRKYNEAFSFEKLEENNMFFSIIKDGLVKFRELFGYGATCFNAPGSYENQILESALFTNGIQFIDSSFIRHEHGGDGIYTSKLRYWGKKSKNSIFYLLRNAVFEPTDFNKGDMVYSCLKEVEAAFFWGKPANISSHRVNFSGGISERHGDRGLFKLAELLKLIVKRWPDVEFMSSAEVGSLIKNS